MFGFAPYDLAAGHHIHYSKSTLTLILYIRNRNYHRINNIGIKFNQFIGRGNVTSIIKGNMDYTIFKTRSPTTRKPIEPSELYANNSNSTRKPNIQSSQLYVYFQHEATRRCWFRTMPIRRLLWRVYMNYQRERLVFLFLKIHTSREVQFLVKHHITVIIG